MKTQKGITLIALIITIIVMLILVGVTVNVALNGGLFDAAKDAANKTEIAMEEEQLYMAVMAAIGTDGEVDYNKLNSNLPEGIEEESYGIYKSTKTGQRYKVNSNGTIELLEEIGEENGETLEGIGIAIGQYKTSKITIAPIIKLTDDEASQIAGSAFGIEANNLREFNEEYIKSQGSSYDEIVDALTDLDQTRKPNDRDVFAYCFSEMGFDTVQQLAEYLIEAGIPYQPEVKLIINGDDKTDIYNQDGFEYPVEYGVEYTIELQKDEKIATKTVKIEEGKPYGWDTNKVAIRIEGENIIPIPKDFEVSESEKEDSIDEGLVIKNNGNEFVWVSVRKPAYTETGLGQLKGNDSYGSKLQMDSYQSMQYYFEETLGEMDSEDDFEKVFTFKEDQENIERSIRTYGGFYVGRYETTYNNYSNGTSQEVGVKQGLNVLKASSGFSVRENGVTNKNRWWGLYIRQKEMYAANSNVGSLMITSKQWNEIIMDTEYEDKTRASNTYTEKPDKAGSLYNGTSNQYDVFKNIYDLAGNVAECTMTAKSLSGNSRMARGGDYNNTDKSTSNTWNWPSSIDASQAGSRVALYIK